MSRKDTVKNFLMNGKLKPEEREEEEISIDEKVIEEPKVETTKEETPEEVPAKVEEEVQADEKVADEPAIQEIAINTSGIEQLVLERTEVLEDTILSLRSEIEELRFAVKELMGRPTTPDMSAYVTTREQLKAVTKVVENENAQSSNKVLVHAMEQIATMREDFFKLCKGMETKIDSMSPRDVLSSFEAYEVDMENILTDGGVFIGHFDYTSLNTIHQRIVEVVTTDDPEKSGLIAERLSDGYKLGNRVLLKEKVSVYKYAQPGAEEKPEESPIEESKAAPPTKTTSKTSSKSKKTGKSDLEEKE
jgi:molecular chaperone GrpE (heat shock protein)